MYAPSVALGHRCRQMLRDRRAAVSIIVAAMLTILIGIGAFAMELGQAYVTHTRNQRVADTAAYTGAVIYTANNNSTTKLNDAITRLTSLNGLPAGSITASVVSSPTGDGNSAIQTQASTSVPLNFAKVFGTTSSATVSAEAYAEIVSPQAGCITALSTSGTGISVTGGATITASGCAIASNGTVPLQNSSIYVKCGATLTAKTVDYASTNPPVQDGCTDINPPAGTSSVTFAHVTSSDQLASNPAVTGATALLSSFPSPPTVNVASSLPTPLVNGSDILFKSGSYTGTFPSGCSAVYSTAPTNNWTVTCATGTHNFGNIHVNGGIALNWNTAGSASNIYTFANAGGTASIDLSSGTSFTFGAGTYEVQGNVTVSQNATFGTSGAATAFYVEGNFNNTNGTTVVQGSSVTFYVQNGLITGGGTTTTLGAGTYKIGAGSGVCNSSSNYSICHGGSSLTILGPSTFTMAGGIFSRGGASLKLGTATLGNTSPTSNSFDIGKASDGNSLYLANNALVTLADASGTGDVFRMAGNVINGNGSCMVLSAATTHYINGYINTGGGSYLGAGTYVVNGYIGLGVNNGGDVTCTINGASTTLGMYGSGVTFVTAGASTVTCDSLATSFCITNGYGHVTLTAPTSGSYSGLAVVGPTASSNTSSAVFTNGASNTAIAGVFYYPHGTIDLSGSGTLHSSGSGPCLELIGAQISITNGGAIGSTCTGLAGSFGGSSMVSLVR